MRTLVGIFLVYPCDSLGVPCLGFPLKSLYVGFAPALTSRRWLVLNPKPSKRPVVTLFFCVEFMREPFP